MKIKELRKLKAEETAKKTSELKSELIKLHGQSATGTPPKSPGQIKKIKKMLAKFNTLQREKELKELGQKIKEELKQKNAQNKNITKKEKTKEEK